MNRSRVVMGFLILTLLACFSIESTARTQDEKQVKQAPAAEQPYAVRIMSRDRDGDGRLSGAEIPPALNRQLDKLDRNKDRALSPEELKGVLAPGGGTTNARNPAQGQAEMEKQILQFALTFDADKDGGLNSAELKKYAAALAARRSTGRSRGGRRGQRTNAPDSQKAGPRGLSGDDDNDPFGKTPNQF